MTRSSHPRLSPEVDTLRRHCCHWLTIVLAAGLLLPGSLPAAMLPLLPQRPFAVGERLEYRIRLGPVTVGSATLEIAGRQDCGASIAYVVRYTARSNRALAALYPVRDRITCWADTLDFRSHRLRKRIREGSYREAWDLRLDHAAGRATNSDGRHLAIPPGCHDVFSALLRLRASQLAADAQVTIPVILGGAVSSMRVQVAGEEQVTVPAGSFRCLVLVPQLGGQGPFRHDGKVTVALSQDARRLPVRVSVKVPVVGRLRAELVEIASFRCNGQIQEGWGCD